MAKKQTSAQKAHKQSEVRRLHNKAIKSTCRTVVKQFVEAVQAKDQAAAEAKLKAVVSTLDSARTKGVLTRNAVARKKSRMTKLYNVSFAAPAK
ncbi:MAG: 30S ribosomal protein S20 [Treponema sp.]|nr:30S ribosomal protein S20 [Treponema sp.]